MNNFVAYEPGVTFKQQHACSTFCSLILVETGNRCPVSGDPVTFVGIGGGGEIISVPDVPVHDHQVRLQQLCVDRDDGRKTVKEVLRALGHSIRLNL